MKHHRWLTVGLAAAILCFTACSASGTVTPPADSPEPDPSYSRGRIEKNIYTSDFAGFRIVLPADWIISSDQELAEAMDIDPVQLADSETFQELADDLPMIYDLMAGSKTGTHSLVVMIEPLSGQTDRTYRTAESYLDAWADRLASLESIAYELGDPYKARLADLDFVVLDAWAPNYGVYQSYYVRKVGNYMMCLTFTGMESPAIGELASCFEAAQ